MQRFRFVYLLVSLVALLLAGPFLSQSPLGDLVIDLLLIPVLGFSILACSRRRLETAIGLGMLALIFGLQWLGRGDATRVGYNALLLFFFTYVSVILTRFVFVETKRVSFDTICGALAVYLLIGLSWAFAYGMLELLQPGSYSFGGEPAAGTDFARFLGFSFITLTTLGYGHIVPETPRADAVAYMEAVVGPIYLTVLVARLVALQMLHAEIEGD